MPGNEIVVMNEGGDITHLIALLDQLRKCAISGEHEPAFPGLDSYVPSFVSSGVDAPRAEYGELEPGTKGD
jgi:hypothetical protein